MAYSTTMNNGQTMIDGATSAQQTLYAQAVNPVDWTKTSCAQDKVAFVNTTSDYSVPNTVRIERSRIGNVYEGTGINTNYQLPSKRGIKLFMQCNSVASMTDSTNPTTRLELPYAASLTLRIPAVPTSIVTYANVLSVLQQLFGLTSPGYAGQASTHANAQVDALSKYLNGSIDFTNWVYA